MSKTILIPTDLHVESLNVLKHALNNSNEKVDAILMYSEMLSTSIHDLLFYSSQKIIKAAITPEFSDALAIIKNRFEKTISSIHIEVFHGYNANAFRRFAKSYNVTEVIIPKSYVLTSSGNSFNPIPMIRKSGITFYEIEWDIKNNISDKNQIDSLFNN